MEDDVEDDVNYLLELGFEQTYGKYHNRGLWMAKMPNNTWKMNIYVLGFEATRQLSGNLRHEFLSEFEKLKKIVIDRLSEEVKAVQSLPSFKQE